jgi:hypothetical protein
MAELSLGEVVSALRADLTPLAWQARLRGEELLVFATLTDAGPLLHVVGSLRYKAYVPRTYRGYKVQYVEPCVADALELEQDLELDELLIW